MHSMAPKTYEVLSPFRVKKILMGYIKSAGTYKVLRDSPQAQRQKRSQGYVKYSETYGNLGTTNNVLKDI